MPGIGTKAAETFHSGASFHTGRYPSCSAVSPVGGFAVLFVRLSFSLYTFLGKGPLTVREIHPVRFGQELLPWELELRQPPTPQSVSRVAPGVARVSRSPCPVCPLQGAQDSRQRDPPGPPFSRWCIGLLFNLLNWSASSGRRQRGRTIGATHQRTISSVKTVCVLCTLSFV